MFKESLVAMGTVFLLGACTSTKVIPQQQENITSQDIEIYQEIKDDQFHIERYREEARLSLKATFERIQKNHEQYEDMLDDGKDRFCKVIKSYREKEEK